MSVWIETFENHSFHSSYEIFKKNLFLLDEEDISDQEILFNIARLKKVTEYFESFIQLVDPELIEGNTINNLNQIASRFDLANSELNHYITHKSIIYLQRANNNIDIILANLRILNTSIPKLSKQKISSILNTYTSTFKNSLKSIDLKKVEAASTSIQNYEKELLYGTEDNDSIKSSIENFLIQSESKYKDIYDFHDKILKEDEEGKSLKSTLDETIKDIFKEKENIDDNLIQVSEKTEKLKEFYIKIYGSVDEKTGERINGLKEDIDKRILDLEKYEKDQKKLFNDYLSDKINLFDRFQENISNNNNNFINEKIKDLEKYEKEIITKNNELYKKIESHLPFATTAGLAKAYEEERKRFRFPLIIWNGVFILTLCCMFIISFKYLNIGNTTIEAFGINIIKTLPLILPCIWLAIYASIRRSENQRLEQEYAHKETLAKSYSGYKKQIDALSSDEDELLLNKLLDNSIETISKNASESLDKKHGDGLPIESIINKVNEQLNSKKK